MIGLQTVSVDQNRLRRIDPDGMETDHLPFIKIENVLIEFKPNEIELSNQYLVFQ